MCQHDSGLYFLLSGLLALLAAGGCTTSLTNLTSARALDPGEHQVTFGGQVNLNSAILSESVAAYKEVRRKVENTPDDRQVAEETFRQLLDAAVAGALFRPSPNPEIGYRLGITDVPGEGFDLGVRYNGQSLKGDVKWQFWESDNGVGAGSLQVGYGHKLSIGLASATRVALTEWSRSDIDVMVPFGATFDNDVRIYAGPRLIWSHISIQPDFDNEIGRRAPKAYKQKAGQLFNDEQILYAGGNLGGMFGYKNAYLAVEVNVMHVAFQPEVLGEPRDLSGVTVTPSIGTVYRF